MFGFFYLKILIMIACVTAILLISYFLSCHWTFSLISSCSLFLILFSSSFQLCTSKYRPGTIRCHCFHYFPLMSFWCLFVSSSRNWNTPIIFDLKEGTVSLILQAEKWVSLFQELCNKTESRLLDHLSALLMPHYSTLTSRTHTCTHTSRVCGQHYPAL